MEYKLGKELVFLDMFFRVLFFEIVYGSMEEEIVLYVYLLIFNLLVLKFKLDEIKEVIVNDLLLKELKDMIKLGWLEIKFCILVSI